MDPVLVKLVSGLFSPIKWLYSTYIDQTRVRIVGADSTGLDSSALPIDDSGSGRGILIFAVATSADNEVEVTRVQVNFSPPLQLLDPESRGFFHVASSLDSELPFKISWDGSALIGPKTMQAFALEVVFPTGVRDSPVGLVIHSRRVGKSVGGFRSVGKEQVTTMRHRAVLGEKGTRGLPIPPQCALTSSQPFLIENSVTATGASGGSVEVHEILKDGKTASKRVILP